jgi:hypothetical protein
LLRIEEGPPEGRPFFIRRGSLADLWTLSDFVIAPALREMAAFHRSLEFIPFNGHLSRHALRPNKRLRVLVFTAAGLDFAGLHR